MRLSRCCPRGWLTTLPMSRTPSSCPPRRSLPAPWCQLTSRTSFRRWIPPWSNYRQRCPRKMQARHRGPGAVLSVAMKLLRRERARTIHMIVSRLTIGAFVRAALADVERHGGWPAAVGSRLLRRNAACLGAWLHVAVADPPAAARPQRGCRSSTLRRGAPPHIIVSPLFASSCVMPRNYADPSHPEEPDA